MAQVLSPPMKVAKKKLCCRQQDCGPMHFQNMLSQQDYGPMNFQNTQTWSFSGVFAFYYFTPSPKPMHTKAQTIPEMPNLAPGSTSPHDRNSNGRTRLYVRLRFRIAAISNQQFEIAERQRNCNHNRL